MKLVITIDTEEDNWGKYCRLENPCANIERLLPLQELFNDFKVLPTYLITYPVAKSERPRSILKRLATENKCEIGAHCHPWNTPPFEEEINEKNSMLTNLDTDLIYRKLVNLHNVIVENIGVTPVSFRAGRFGFGENVLEALRALHYRIDTSITPFQSWTINGGPDFSHISPKPFFLQGHENCQHKEANDLLEVPTTTGFYQRHFEAANSVFQSLHKKPFDGFRLIGILDALHLVNRVSLNPELFNARQMIALTNRFRKNGFKVLNMNFHSTTLMSGLNDFVKSEKDERMFFNRIRDFLAFAQNTGIESIRLSQCCDIINLTN